MKMKEESINMDVKSTIWTFLIIHGYFCLSLAETHDFCKMERILTNRFETECVLCSKNSDTDCPRNATKLTTDNGHKNCQLDLNMGNETDPRIITTTGCSHICLENIPDPYCCDGYYGPNCLGKLISLIPIKLTHKFSKTGLALGLVAKGEDNGSEILK